MSHTALTGLFHGECMDGTNIRPWHKTAFDALVSGDSQGMALFSCFLNDEPTAAIVNITRDGADDYRIIPMFVAVTPGMKLTNHEGVEA